LLRKLAFSIGVAALAGCALKGDVHRVELEIATLRTEMASGEAVRKAQTDSLLALVGALQQALAAQQAYLVQLRGDFRTDLLSVQQELVTIQELTGQSQQRLTELRSRIEQQAQQPVPPVESTPPSPTPAAPGAPAAPSAGPNLPGPDQMYHLSLSQYRRGSLTTARLGFREFLRVYPTDPRVPDALFFIGETFAPDNPDSAAALYQQVVGRYPNSSRAPSALYKLGLLAEARGQKATARTYYQRVIAGYPRSDEANLARDKLQRLGR
jgi:tol-pal system protein YbgF